MSELRDETLSGQALRSPTKLVENLVRRLSGKSRWLLLSLLASLHLIAVQGVDSATSRVLLLGHAGLFLLWQPFVRAETQLSRLELSIVSSLCVAMAIWANPAALMVWVMVLAGIISGKVFLADDRAARMFHLLALAYLLALLLALLLPDVLPLAARLPQGVVVAARYGVPAVLLVMALLPGRDDRDGRGEVIDFVYSAFVFLLLAVLVLGALALMLLTGMGYVPALVTATVSMSAVLFVLGWAWNPRIGFAGLGLAFSRYMLSVGMPFEEWLDTLTGLARAEPDPHRFVTLACDQLVSLPGVRGGRWLTGDADGRFGAGEGAIHVFTHPALRVDLLTRKVIGPALIWHFNLLVQMLGEFYLAKVQARELERMSYVRAVHETGARLTHDVKNLLQSLNALCFAAEKEGGGGSPAFQAMLRRQLPTIAQRLTHTLDKLRRPEAEQVGRVSALRWWGELQARFAGSGVVFSSGEIGEGVMLRGTLFDRVGENLIRNALDKRSAAAAEHVSVALTASEEGSSLRVCDDGHPVPAEKVELLVRAPVASESGLGIGLYQVGRQAELEGYRLVLSSNEPGRVCFLLEPDPDRLGIAIQ